MRKLYNGKGKRIHPSPPPSSPFNFLAALPSTLLTLAASLSPEEKEVLVYLLSDDVSSGNKKLHQPCNHGRTNHPPALGCGCFVCYMSFWARWNASPNHLLIHRIIDAFEESIEPRSICSVSRRRRRRGARRRDSGEEISPLASAVAVEVSNDGDDEGYDDDDVNEKEFDGIGQVAAGGEDGRSSVRRLVSFIGERVWGVWNY